MHNDEGLQRNKWLQFCQHSHILFIPSQQRGGFTPHTAPLRTFLANTAQRMSEPQSRIIKCWGGIEARSCDLVDFGSSWSTWVNSWPVTGTGVMQREVQDSYSHKELLCPAGSTGQTLPEGFLGTPAASPTSKCSNGPFQLENAATLNYLKSKCTIYNSYSLSAVNTAAPDTKNYKRSQDGPVSRVCCALFRCKYLYKCHNTQKN